MDNARECLRDADVVLITTPDPEFKALAAVDFVRQGRSVLVMDFWRILSDKLAGVPGIDYIPYGVGGASTAGTLTELWGATPTHYGR
jgi:hypothetical protein